MTESWSVSALEGEALQSMAAARRWKYENVALSPARLISAARDRRLNTKILVAIKAGRPGGMVSLQQPRNDAAVERRYDPRIVAGFSAPDSPRKWLYVGGFRSLTSGTTVADDLLAHEVRAIRRALIQASVREAESTGLFPFALYVGSAEVDDFTAALDGAIDKVHIADEAVLHMGGRTIHDHLGSLTSNARHKVRREWKLIETLDLKAKQIGAEEIIPDASKLIADAKIRHGVMDHEQMAKLRLQEWAKCTEGKAIAFSVSDRSGDLLGVSFAMHIGDRIEVSEMGLVAEMPNRHLVYTELLVHAPSRYALRHGCAHVGLGLGSLTPKSQRGAKAYPLWAIQLGAPNTAVTRPISS